MTLADDDSLAELLDEPVDLPGRLRLPLQVCEDTGRPRPRSGP
jgi:hypothetical protein